MAGRPSVEAGGAAAAVSEAGTAVGGRRHASRPASVSGSIALGRREAEDRPRNDSSASSDARIAVAPRNPWPSPSNAR